jgi:DNA-binding transcriptional ArsR family regulator
MSDIFTVLADPTRRALLQALAVKSQSVSELVELTGEGQPSVSKHLKTLREAGLVSVAADGQSRIYSIDRGPLGEVGAFLAEVAPGQDGIGAGSAPKTSLIEQGLEAGVEIASQWITAGAGWLGAKLQDGVSSIDVDTAELGRELGRKLAEARSSAGTLAADAQGQIGADFADLGDLLAERFGAVKESAASIAADLLELAKRDKPRAEVADANAFTEGQAEAEAAVVAATTTTGAKAKQRVVNTSVHEDEEF